MQKKILNSPIRKNLSASSFGFLIHLGNQVLMVPLFLMVWGVEKYGDWILLTAFTIIFAMSDAGLGSVTQSQFSIEYNRKDYKKCYSLMTNNIILILCITLIILGCCSVFFEYNNIVKVLGLHVVSASTGVVVVLCSMSSIFVKMLGTVYESVFRAMSLSHRGILIKQLNALTNIVFTIFFLITTKSMVNIVISVLLSDIFFLIYTIVKTYTLFPFVPYMKYVNFKIFKEMFTPSFSFLCYPLSNTLIFQGYTYLANFMFGVEIMVIYNTTRTVVYVIKKITIMLNESVQPEYSVAYGKRDIARMQIMHRKAYSLNCIITLFLVFFILCFGRMIYSIWTNDSIPYSFSLATAFCILICARNFWEPSNTVIIATNCHVRYSIYYLLGTILSFLLSMVIIRYYHHVVFLVLSQLLIDFMSAIVVIKKAITLTNDTIRGFLFSPSYYLLDNWAKIKRIYYL